MDWLILSLLGLLDFTLLTVKASDPRYSCYAIPVPFVRYNPETETCFVPSVEDNEVTEAKMLNYPDAEKFCEDLGMGIASFEFEHLMVGPKGFGNLVRRMWRGEKIPLFTLAGSGLSLWFLYVTLGNSTKVE